MVAEQIEYLMEFEELQAKGNNLGWSRSVDEFKFRQEWTAAYAWAIPSEEALATIKKYGPIVEIGAGTGYWAHLLRQRGVDILAYDRNPPPNEGNFHHKNAKCWTTVEHGGPGIAAAHSDRTLFLCWPPYDTPMAADCLAAYTGKTVIYIGESWGGCTGDNKFFAELDANWEQVEEVDIPQYSWIHDYLYVYRRKA